MEGSSAWLASGPWQASQFTEACLPWLFCVGDVCVACFAGLVSGEVDWLRGDFAHRGSTEVSVLSERVRHQPAADAEKDQDGNDEDSRKPEEMTCIAKIRIKLTSQTQFQGGVIGLTEIGTMLEKGES